MVGESGRLVLLVTSGLSGKRILAEAEDLAQELGSRKPGFHPLDIEWDCGPFFSLM